MEKDAIAQSWLRTRLESKKAAEAVEAVEEPSREEMLAEIRRYHEEQVLSNELYTILKHRGERTEHTTNAYGSDRSTRYKQTIIDLGSAKLDGHKNSISTRAVLLETYTWGQDAFMAGTERTVQFQAKDSHSRKDHFAAIPDGTFQLKNVPISPQHDLKFGFLLNGPETYRVAQEALPNLLQFNQQLKDVAEIIGVEAPTLETVLAEV